MKFVDTNLGQRVKIAISGEVGTIIGQCVYLYEAPSVYVEYKAADGSASSSWFSPEQLEIQTTEDDTADAEKAEERSGPFVAGNVHNGDVSFTVHVDAVDIEDLNLSGG
ncbi:MAG: hypothetical protein COA62_15830 [Rhodobiaceae bacterium]|nr:MAG: hypothetical protein COA62_15830 [Rhodobiaceae bacterium]